MRGCRGDEISLQVGRHQRGDLRHPVEVAPVPMALQMVVVVVSWSSVVEWMLKVCCVFFRMLLV